MRPARELATPVLAAVVLAALVLAAAAAVAEEPMRAWFVSPPALEPAIGEVELEIGFEGAGVVREARFLVDGREVGRLSRPPYRLLVELGEEFGPHRFEAVLMGADGELARAVRETPGLRIDEQIDLGLQQLYVALEGARPAAPLTAGEFAVIDDGRRQEIVTFEGGDAALAVALLIDASQSMVGGALEAAVGGARALLEGMQALDEASLVLFADAVLHRGPYTQEPAELARALEGVSAAGGTALNDALYLAIRQLESRQGRRVVVLLSDGLDIHSALSIEEVLWAARRSRSVVYWIELRGPRYQERVVSPWRSADQHDAERRGLAQLVRETGGRVVPIAEAGEAGVAFGEILAELRSQYVLGYYPTRDLDDGAWHPVAVRVAAPGVRARTRGGYVDD